MRRYNRLRKKGYFTIDGTDCEDIHTGELWSEIIMTNGIKLKRVKVREISGYKWLIKVEQNSKIHL